MINCYTILQFLKQEDVKDQIQVSQWHIQHRGSLMARLLHHTIDHARERTSERESEGEGETQDTDTESRTSLVVDV